MTKNKLLLIRVDGNFKSALARVSKKSKVSMSVYVVTSVLKSIKASKK